MASGVTASNYEAPLQHAVYLTAVPCWEQCQILLDKCTQMVTGDADSSLSQNITLFKCEVVTRVTIHRQRVKLAVVKTSAFYKIYA